MIIFDLSDRKVKLNACTCISRRNLERDLAKKQHKQHHGQDRQNTHNDI